MEENPCPKSELFAWSDGRRIVDLCELSKQLHCKQCSSLLDLQRTEREARYGLASVLYIHCNCGVMNDVHTGRTLHGNHRNSHSSDPVYEVNVKAAENLQMYVASASCILSFLALLDVPVSGHHDATLLMPATLHPHTPPFPTHIRSASGGLPTDVPPACSPPDDVSLSTAASDVSRPSQRRLPTPPPPLSRACASEVGSGFRLVPCSLPSVHNCDRDDSDDGAGCDHGHGASPAAGGDLLERADDGTVVGARTGVEEDEEGDDEGDGRVPPIKIKARARNSHTTKKSSSRKARAGETLKMVVQRISLPKAKVKAEPAPAHTAEENGKAEKEESAGEIDFNAVEWFSTDSEAERSQGRESDASWHDGEEKRTGVKGKKRGRGQPKRSAGKVKRARKRGPGAKNAVSTEEKERPEDGESNPPPACAVCGKGFSSARGYGLHMRRVHGHEPQQDQQDQQPIKQEGKERVLAPGRVLEEEEEAVTREVMQEVTGQLFRCPRCPAVFSDPKRFFGHSERRHPGLEAEEKGKLYPVSMKGAIVKKSLVRKDGSESASYQCSQCGRVLPSAATMGGHLRVTSDDRLSCVVLSPLGVKIRAKTLELSIGREEHRPCLCSVCGKVYANPTSLSTHVKEVHAQKKKFSCHVCSAAFTRYGNLQYHLGTHQTDRARPCVCPTCGKSFFTGAHLKHHMRNQHRNAPPLLCHVCGKAFFTTRTLKDHAVIHTGQRKFSCPECPMTFYKKYNLTVHQRIHSGHRPYRCPLCPLTFAQKHSLDYHMSKHGPSLKKAAPDPETVQS